jgi:hypothetical protein
MMIILCDAHCGEGAVKVLQQIIDMFNTDGET